MSIPLVSVIVPIYNAQLYLSQTVDSILKSSYPNIEIILLDDDSNDNTPQIAKALAKQYSNILYQHQPNAGASAARNHAIRLSNGKSILPVDADDLISEYYISEAFPFL